MEQSLIEANKPRAIEIAAILARRAESGGFAGAWNGYHKAEGLLGVLVTQDILRYARPGHDGDNNSPFATLFFKGPKLTDTVNVDWGSEIPVQDNIIERTKDSITKVKGVEFDDKITHTFSKTRTMQEAFKIGAELAVKAGVSESGVSAEVSAKLTAEYSKQWGESETHTDTVERTIVLPKEFEGEVNYEAVRSINKVKRRIKATTNMDYHVTFVSGPVIPPANAPYFDFEWDSIETLINVGKGYAPSNVPMYKAFMDNKMTLAEIDAIREKGEQTIDFTIEYDQINTQVIKIL